MTIAAPPAGTGGAAIAGLALDGATAASQPAGFAGLPVGTRLAGIVALGIDGLNSRILTEPGPVDLTQPLPWPKGSAVAVIVDAPAPSMRLLVSPAPAATEPFPTPAPSDQGARLPGAPLPAERPGASVTPPPPPPAQPPAPAAARLLDAPSARLLASVWPTTAPSVETVVAAPAAAAPPPLAAAVPANSAPAETASATDARPVPGGIAGQGAIPGRAPGGTPPPFVALAADDGAWPWPADAASAPDSSDIPPPADPRQRAAPTTGHAAWPAAAAQAPTAKRSRATTASSGGYARAESAGRSSSSAEAGVAAGRLRALEERPPADRPEEKPASPRSADGEWRIVPVQAGVHGGSDAARVFWREHPGASPQEPDGPGKSVRFVVDLTLSRIGRVQIDGLAGDDSGPLRLAIRGAGFLTDTDKAQLMRTIQAVFTGYGRSGDLIFPASLLPLGEDAPPTRTASPAVDV